jgi:hypothetical protein
MQEIALQQVKTIPQMELEAMVGKANQKMKVFIS